MPTVARHRTAMARNFVSRPVQIALRDGLLPEGTTFFDYGCGRGADVRHLRQLGYLANGWDPAHAPDSPLCPADVVNLGYVVNVIEQPTERVETLRRAWKLAKSVLVVAARLDWEASALDGESLADGLVTRAGTFQKFFAQDELRAWIDAVLSVKSVAAAPGIFYVFRSSADAQRLLAEQTRAHERPQLAIAELIYQQQKAILDPLEVWVEEHRRLPAGADIPEAPALIDSFGSIRAAFSLVRRVTDSERWSGVDVGTRRRSDERFAANLEILQPLIDFLSERGRLPRPGELESTEAIDSEFGSIRAAFSLVRRVSGSDRWIAYEAQAREDFLVYMALSAFGGRPKLSDLPSDLQYDVKDFFGTYKAACAAADELLFAVGNLDAIDRSCREADFGKLTPEALYVHVAGLARLSPLLRVYEGCARMLTGDVEEATLLKLHRLKPQVSFLVYPTFDRDPHPALEASIVARLGRLRVTYRDFSTRENPPVLHRKESFVPLDYPSRAKFARLTLQEERAGLLDAPTIGTREGWTSTLNECRFALRGHRLVRADGG